MLSGNRIEDLLQNSFALHANKTALLSENTEYSYHQVDLISQRICDALRQSDLQENEPVLIVCDNKAENLIAMAGIWRAKGVVVPLDRQASSDTTSNLIERTQARYLIGLPDGLSNESVSIIDPKIGLYLLKSSIIAENFDHLEDAAFIVFTSGSTGVPKGVILSHKGYCQKVKNVDSVIHFNPTDNVLLALKLTFSFGQWTSVLSLCKGCTIFLISKFSAEKVLHIIQMYNITKYPIVPSMMRLILQEESSNDSLSLLNVLFMAGGEILPSYVGEQFLKKFPSSAITDIYGSTETNSADFILLPEDYRNHKGKIGKESPSVLSRIVRADGVEAALDEVGELQINTPFIMKGYLGQPTVTEAAFSGEYFKTGDLAFKNKDGFVSVVGRLKDEIHRGGNKISPAEIENAYMQYHGIKLTACIAVKNEILGEKSLIVYEGDEEFEIESLKEFGKSKLERYKIPDYFMRTDKIPLGKTGKIDRASLRLTLYESYLVT